MIMDCLPKVTSKCFVKQNKTKNMKEKKSGVKRSDFRYRNLFGRRLKG